MNTIQSQCILVTGAARSGKSEWAEQLARHFEEKGLSIMYVATSLANPDDAEWQARLEYHRQRRPNTWACVEGPIDLVSLIAASGPHTCLLVDSLGTWLANLLDYNDREWHRLLGDVGNTLTQTNSTIIFVAEEVGWGVVPAYPVGRIFRDRLGQLTRNIGAIATTTYLVTGGHVLNLSELGHPLLPSSSFIQPTPSNP